MSFDSSPPRPNPKPLSPNEVARAGLCIGCGGCVAQAGRGDAGMALNDYGELKPCGPRAWTHARQTLLAATCPFSPDARSEDELAARHFPLARTADPLIGRYEAAYVGAAEEPGFRANGSSGGMVSWVAAELLRMGLVDGVAHVAPDVDGHLFGYRISRSLAELNAGAKSRYYPVEMSGVLREMRAVPGRYAVVGIPCFIKAVRLLCGTDPVLRERIAFTLGLFCGHMKSARMAESFAWQLGTDISDVERFEYRAKAPDRPANWYRAEVKLKDGEVRGQDWWHLVDGDWGAGFFMNSTCNFCDDVTAETADIAFGDAWVEPYASDGRGTNVVIVRSPAVHDLIQAGMASERLALEAVDARFVSNTQAAGFRQRREGLAYRLTWPRLGLRPRKRVTPSRALPFRRKVIYVMRAGLSAWSHRVFWLARSLRRPAIYTGWARAALALYHGLAYGRGPVGAWLKRFGVAGVEG